MKHRFFRTAGEFRKWLAKNHAAETELLVGFYTKTSGKTSITWQESVREAICFGWIDGIRRNVDPVSYSIRFTPRKRTSIWSAINIGIAKELIKQGLMRPPGLAAYKLRRDNKSAVYAYEQHKAVIPEPYAGLLKKNKRAFAFYEAQSPSYRKLISWWIVSAKQEETRAKRIKKLIAESAAGRRL
ncbi:MAG: YdeI/OmpD-associated family protein [Planctomycetes bacterium]|nr:YdeI/OmpD-associated family protein [Planctomycetota bacterium]